MLKSSAVVSAPFQASDQRTWTSGNHLKSGANNAESTMSETGKFITTQAALSMALRPNRRDHL